MRSFNQASGQHAYSLADRHPPSEIPLQFLRTADSRSKVALPERVLGLPGRGLRLAGTGGSPCRVVRRRLRRCRRVWTIARGTAKRLHHRRFRLLHVGLAGRGIALRFGSAGRPVGIRWIFDLARQSGGLIGRAVGRISKSVHVPIAQSPSAFRNAAKERTDPSGTDLEIRPTSRWQLRGSRNPHRRPLHDRPTASAASGRRCRRRQCRAESSPTARARP